MSRPAGRIFRFEVRLDEIEPAIWRQIEVPSNYTFWDLHVAIQDAMGWLDYHLHEFTPVQPAAAGPVRIGIPEDSIEEEVLAGWLVPIAMYFAAAGDSALYEYDFGDGWSHDVRLVAIEAKKPGAKYPRCTGGGRACPPEDCGGVPGYEDLLEILSDSSHEEHADTIAWLQGHAGHYHPYHPDGFDPRKVKFWNPKKRLKMMLDEYLRQRAAQDQRKHIAVCHVLVRDGNPKRILGYYTLSNYSVGFDTLPEALASRLPKYPRLPAALLGRLAVDQDFRGQGHGEWLLLDAMRRAFTQVASQMAIYALVVHAKDERAAEFYERYGFQRFPASPLALFTPMATIAKLFEDWR